MFVRILFEGEAPSSSSEILDSTLVSLGTSSESLYLLPSCDTSSSLTIVGGTKLLTGLVVNDLSF